MRYLFVFFTCLPVYAASPLVIAHRGASGHRPEHTLSSYNLAIDQGADFIEPDLVVSKDGVLIARHENNIADTTDVAQKFPDRKTTKTIDGNNITGYFTEDFTLAELKTLRAKERLPFRSHSHDGKDEILTFAEVLDLAKRRHVSVYPETKHPTYFRSIGLPLEPLVISELKMRGWTTKKSPVIIQSFELGSLQELHKSLDVRLMFLFETSGDWTKPDELRKMAKYLYAIGPFKRLIVPEVNGRLQTPTTLIKDAHAVGLKVHPWAFRSDKEYLHASYLGKPEREYEQFIKLGVDGIFTDFPDDAVKSVKACATKLKKSAKAH